mmetsp:Transcript_12728/g.29064  ORF Transcript_12728/g.29064 Transcript_12728/m.29064 type:complete len:249 (+) Transcript_12728:4717-5463(+)
MLLSAVAIGGGILGVVKAETGVTFDLTSTSDKMPALLSFPSSSSPKGIVEPSLLLRFWGFKARILEWGGGARSNTAGVVISDISSLSSLTWISWILSLSLEREWANDGCGSVGVFSCLLSFRSPRSFCAPPLNDVLSCGFRDLMSECNGGLMNLRSAVPVDEGASSFNVNEPIDSVSVLFFPPLPFNPKSSMPSSCWIDDSNSLLRSRYDFFSLMSIDLPRGFLSTEDLLDLVAKSAAGGGGPDAIRE